MAATTVTTVTTRAAKPKHPYLAGNFAPVASVRALTACPHSGEIPDELAGGQYVRNGGNPAANDDLGRDAHWFDGDGMLTGVAFRRGAAGLQALFVNQFVLTDVYLYAAAHQLRRRPVLPSIATLVNPASALVCIVLQVLRTLALVLLSHLPGSRQAIKRISVVNTSVVYHDGRALAGCESGPPLRVQLPGLETVGWYDGGHAEGEPEPLPTPHSPRAAFGGPGPLGFLREWTTAHPKVDPATGEMVLFHCTFVPPYVQYSVIPPDRTSPPTPRIVSAAVPGVSGAKMMHDFGVSRRHTVILDLPLSLDPLHLLQNGPVVAYDRHKPARFGVFPRYHPRQVRWFETAACCIFHTANCWDSTDKDGTDTVHLLASRLNSESLVFNAGNIVSPSASEPATVSSPSLTTTSLSRRRRRRPDGKQQDTNTAVRPSAAAAAAATESIKATDECIHDEKPTPPHNLHDLHEDEEGDDDDDNTNDTNNNEKEEEEGEQCRLYYYSFSLASATTPTITAQFALSCLPFEFPTLNPAFEMSDARFIYGCSTTTADFGTALGRAAKIDVLLKMDVHTLLARADRPALARCSPGMACVDKRPLSAVVASTDPKEPITCFCMPSGWFAQEARFVSRRNAVSEDDGFLLFYAFDEGQLDEDGEAPPDAKSELWIVDAKSMKDVIARVKLPQRVPYGLHGNWFDESKILAQRPVEKLREPYRRNSKAATPGQQEEEGLWMLIRQKIEKWLE